MRYSLRIVRPEDRVGSRCPLRRPMLSCLLFWNDRTCRRGLRVPRPRQLSRFRLDPRRSGSAQFAAEEVGRGAEAGENTTTPVRRHRRSRPMTSTSPAHPRPPEPRVCEAIWHRGTDWPKSLTLVSVACASGWQHEIADQTFNLSQPSQYKRDP
jgi:hypothetical protein